VFLVDPAQVAEGFSEGQRIGVSVSKPCGGHAPRLDVGVAVASSDGEDPYSEECRVARTLYCST
jgi:hypothetical protein